jgi:CRISPR-associated protein Cas1
MIKRTLYFGNPAYLRLKDQQLSVEIKVEEVLKITTIPVEDIGIVVIDHPQITLTSGLLQALQENKVAVITCDYRHMPQSVLLPLEGNRIQQERYDTQLAATEPLKKQLWQQTIIQKIKNQAATLESKALPSDYLIPLHRNVKSGDTDNCEATAANYYWQTIFSTLLPSPFEEEKPVLNEQAYIEWSRSERRVRTFIRHREGASPNNFLNYGYAILRATMARSIVAAGLLPTLGIFHRNRYNAFCLADDLMEPYRPYVDQIVHQMVTEMGVTDEMTKDHKAILLKIPAIDVTMDGEKSPLMLATQRTAVSLVKCYAGEQRKLLYPEFG